MQRKNKTIGQLIRAEREARGLYLNDLADMLTKRGAPISDAGLSRIENDVYRVPLRIVGALADALGLLPQELRPDIARVFRAGNNKIEAAE